MAKRPTIQDDMEDSLNELENLRTKMDQQMVDWLYSVPPEKRQAIADFCGTLDKCLYLIEDALKDGKVPSPEMQQFIERFQKFLKTGYLDKKDS